MSLLRSSISRIFVVMYPTPQIGHLTEADYQHVYEPAEDSFALLDALEGDLDQLRVSGPLCVEIGTGSGIVSSFLSSLMGSSCFYLGTDINSFCCRASLSTATANNNQRFDVLRCDALQPLMPRIAGQVDILVFNPPYVPTTMVEFGKTQGDRDLGASWAGGEVGMELTDRVLSLLPTLLSECGRFYLVAIEQNQPQKILAEMSAMGLASEVILRRKAGREVLYIIRATRTKGLA